MNIPSNVREGKKARHGIGFHPLVCDREIVLQFGVMLGRTYMLPGKETVLTMPGS